MYYIFIKSIFLLEEIFIIYRFRKYFIFILGNGSLDKLFLVNF